VYLVVLFPGVRYVYGDVYVNIVLFAKEKRVRVVRVQAVTSRDGSGYLFGCQFFGLLSSIVNK
jgi:hypothetical protein